MKYFRFSIVTAIVPLLFSFSVKAAAISNQIFCDLESQKLDDNSICEHLTNTENLIFLTLKNTIKREIESHLYSHNMITEEQIKNIIWSSFKKLSIHTATSLTLLSSYIGLNILYAWGVSYIPYPSLSSTLYTFQTILGIAISAPILTPIASTLRKKAFNFRELKSSSAIETNALEELWYSTSKELSMNAEMSRNVILYYLLFLQIYKDNIQRLVENKTNENLSSDIACQISLFLINNKTLFPEIKLSDKLVANEVSNFIVQSIKLITTDNYETIFNDIEIKVMHLSGSNDVNNIFISDIQMLKNYWDHRK